MSIHRMLTTFIVTVTAIVILNQSMFFSFMGLLGVNYEGSESSNIYIIYLTALFIFTLASYLYTVLTIGLSQNELVALGLLVLFFFVHLLWVLFDPSGTQLFPMLLIHSVMLGFVGLFAALTIVKVNLMDRLIKMAELFFVIQGVGIATYSVLNTLAGIKVASLAGATYQALSYYSAFTMGMLIAYAFLLPSNLRYTFTKNVVYKSFLYTLTLSCALGVLIGGGRGAFLLMLAYLALASWYMFFGHKAISHRKLLQLLLRLITLAGLILIFLIIFKDMDFIQSGFRRATQFISSDGIDLARGSSGRDRVYAIALQYIFQQPIMGYGPFGVYDKSIHAHNVFLELWLQFGLFIFIALIICGYFIIKKLNQLNTDYKIWLVFLSLYPVINIQFSSTYLTSPIIWFFLATIFLIKNRDSPS